jgi:hypothetical protein
MELLKKYLALLNWEKLLAQAYKDLRPYLAKKVLDSKNKLDDMAIVALDNLVEKYLDPKVLDGEKSVQDLIEAAK